MKEVDKLIEKAEDSLDTAELLYREKHYDVSVSRSYYAMFYPAEALLLIKRIDFSSHKSVISLFGEHFVKTGLFKPDFGRKLNEAYKKRLKGDYSYNSVTDEDAAKKVLEWATEFVNEVKNYIKKEGGSP